MLQQTQVAIVVPYFLRFMEAYPDVVRLANAPVDDVLRLWSGLGYYARARNLYKAACEIRDHHGGEFPRDFEQIVALPGVGRSTAGAIVALSRGERHAILDGNVKRVLARYHAVAGWPGASSVARELWLLAERHTPDQRIAEYTQAIMDLGATVCTRKRPACLACPLPDGCGAYATQRVDELPAARPKRDKPRRQTHMVLALCNGDVYLERRPPSGIWGGLWSLPELERDDQLEDWCRVRLAAKPVEIERWTPLRHSFTHFDLDIRPVAVRVTGVSRKLGDGADRVWYDFRSEAPFGIAAPVRKLIEQLKFTNERE
jgi:A/G-specific adenine glycosylase